MSRKTNKTPRNHTGLKIVLILLILLTTVLGALLRMLTWVLQKAQINQILINVAATFLLSATAIVAVRNGLGSDAN